MADAKDIMLHREVSARIGKSRLYDAALSCALTRLATCDARTECLTH